MNWPVSLLHVIGSEDVGNSGKSVQKPVLKSEHRGWPDDSSLGENGSCNVFTLSLGPEEFRRGVKTSVIGGNMDVSVNVIFGNRFHNSFCSFNVDILVREVPIPSY